MFPKKDRHYLRNTEGKADWQPGWPCSKWSFTQIRPVFRAVEPSTLSVWPPGGQKRSDHIQRSRPLNLHCLIRPFSGLTESRQKTEAQLAALLWGQKAILSTSWQLKDDQYYWTWPVTAITSHLLKITFASLALLHWVALKRCKESSKNYLLHYRLS